jgi:hypothetical protein
MCPARRSELTSTLAGRLRDDPSGARGRGGAARPSSSCPPTCTCQPSPASDPSHARPLLPPCTRHELQAGSQLQASRSGPSSELSAGSGHSCHLASASYAAPPAPSSSGQRRRSRFARPAFSTSLRRKFIEPSFRPSYFSRATKSPSERAAARVRLGCRSNVYEGGQLTATPRPGRRLDRARTYHEGPQRPLLVRPRPLSAVDRRGHHRLPRRLARGPCWTCPWPALPRRASLETLSLTAFESPPCLAPDGQAEPAAIRAPAQDPELRRPVRLDDGPDRLDNRQKEQLYVPSWADEARIQPRRRPPR